MFANHLSKSIFWLDVKQLCCKEEGRRKRGNTEGDAARWEIWEIGESFPQFPKPPVAKPLLRVFNNPIFPQTSSLLEALRSSF
ncbi:hypothetical protein IQ238_00130 [Pleurocapsales cyanobacterium LEGE 06147]|nr:hypothetical protein [Pleurocapsales cyanobacterium LEGE 06147]